jgi:hypothetical protein
LGTDYDWRQKRRSMPGRTVTTIEGVDIHFVHVFPAPNALPLIMTLAGPARF